MISRRSEDFFDFKALRSSSSADQNPGLLPLPRELRDEIYNYVSCGNYRVKVLSLSPGAVKRIHLSAGYRTTFLDPVDLDFQRPPAYHRPQPVDPLRLTDTTAPWAEFAPDFDRDRFAPGLDRRQRCRIDEKN